LQPGRASICTTAGFMRRRRTCWRTAGWKVLIEVQKARQACWKQCGVLQGIEAISCHNTCWLIQIRRRGWTPSKLLWMWINRGWMNLKRQRMILNFYDSSTESCRRWRKLVRCGHISRVFFQTAELLRCIKSWPNMVWPRSQKMKTILIRVWIGLRKWSNSIRTKQYLKLTGLQ